jgi:Dyp-type peroxidase family
MPLGLNNPLPANPDADQRAMLNQLQGNILKSHGRDRTAHVFIRVRKGRALQARAFLRSYAAGKLMSAAQQHEAAAIFKREGPASQNPLVKRAFISIAISAEGYEALRVDANKIPADPSFRSGLKNPDPRLADPLSTTWNKGYRGAIHAMITIAGKADSDASDQSSLVEAEIASLAANARQSGFTLIGMERGRGYRNSAGQHVEHFEYADGVSQPLMMQMEIDQALGGVGGAPAWNPAFPMNQALVKDPGVADPNALGSYLVFRKLEQNVKAFLAAETALQTSLASLAQANGSTMPADLAGAMLVGRFRDGTPVSLTSAPIGSTTNNFGFADDMQGAKCPFHAHIRKTNPRGDSARLFPNNVTEASERAHLFPRRGITYGKRRQRNGRFTDKPSRGVGLLFMAYQSDIARQFEFMQGSWSNQENFVRPLTGVDGIIGQGGRIPQKHRAVWNQAQSPIREQFFGDFVTMKGGEYFFAPSLTFFNEL